MTARQVCGVLILLALLVAGLAAMCREMDMGWREGLRFARDILVWTFGCACIGGLVLLSMALMFGTL